MKQASAILIYSLLVFSATHLTAEDIILRLSPEASAPILNRITATEKVLMDAVPAAENEEWMQLDLKLPFEGYVPAATLTKNLAIIQQTPVHFLPDTSSETITRAMDGDIYEIKRVKDEWATVRFNKELTVYFRAGAVPSAATVQKPEPVPEPPLLDLTLSAPTHTPEPNAANFDPTLGVGQTSPDDLPPENVVWKSAPRAPAPIRGPQPKAVEKTPAPPSLPNGIMVSSDQTQAREARTQGAPPKDQPVRLLVGTLVRKIETTNPAYPVRLLSEEGRLIAYVDFSGYFIEDLSPYLNQRVYLRGQLVPTQTNDKELVIFVRNIQIAE